jgi:hypothetical protein
MDELQPACYYSVAEQERLGYECSEIIGWNTVGRRNIAILEALRLGAEIIISVNDDDIPMGKDYFNMFRSNLMESYNGVQLTSSSGWVNVGDLLFPRVYHRGFPYQEREKEPCKTAPITNVKVGISEGIVMGDPDVDAVDRVASNPRVLSASDILRNGIVVCHNCFSPFNNENTAYRREIAPVMMLPVGLGRADDIFSAYVAERILADTDYYIHHGQPFAWQQRNPHDLLSDLSEEMFQMQNVWRFVQSLQAMKLPNGDTLTKLSHLYGEIARLKYMPSILNQLAKAWSTDIEQVL